MGDISELDVSVAELLGEKLVVYTAIDEDREVDDPMTDELSVWLVDANVDNDAELDAVVIWELDEA